MVWLDEYRRDIERYTILRSKESLFTIFMTEQGLWALLQYRIASGIYRSNLSWPIKRPLLILMVAWQKWVEIVAGIYLPYAATIGPGLYIGHFGNIMVHAKAVLGENCNIHQGMTIGEAGRGKNWGVPVIGDRVYIGPNSTVIGKVTLGNDSLVAPNSLVTRSVPEHMTVLGVPAKVVGDGGSIGYIVLGKKGTETDKADVTEVKPAEYSEVSTN